MAFGDRLREVRLSRASSQAEFAALIGASARTQQDWERGVSQPNAIYLTAMAAIGVDVIYLLTGLQAAPDVVHAFARSARATLEAAADDTAALERLANLNIEAMRMTLVPPLSADEVGLVRAYRALGPEARRAIDATLAAVGAKAPNSSK